jgi:hypothetical protein
MSLLFSFIYNRQRMSKGSGLIIVEIIGISHTRTTAGAKGGLQAQSLDRRFHSEKCRKVRKCRGNKGDILLYHLFSLLGVRIRNLIAFRRYGHCGKADVH